MSMAKWRREFLVQCGRSGVPEALRDRLLRDAPAIQRAAEAECSLHEKIAAPFIRRGEAAERRILRTVAECNAANGTKFRTEFGGDPRGATVKLHAGDREFGVPAAGFTASQMERLAAARDKFLRGSFAARLAGAVRP